MRGLEPLTPYMQINNSPPSRERKTRRNPRKTTSRNALTPIGDFTDDHRQSQPITPLGVRWGSKPFAYPSATLRVIRVVCLAVPSRTKLTKVHAVLLYGSAQFCKFSRHEVVGPIVLRGKDA